MTNVLFYQTEWTLLCTFQTTKPSFLRTDNSHVSPWKALTLWLQRVVDHVRGSSNYYGFKLQWSQNQQALALQTPYRGARGELLNQINLCFRGTTQATCHCVSSSCSG
eukprot:s3991_g5.t1